MGDNTALVIVIVVRYFTVCSLVGFCAWYFDSGWPLLALLLTGGDVNFDSDRKKEQHPTGGSRE